MLFHPDVWGLGSLAMDRNRLERIVVGMPSVARAVDLLPQTMARLDAGIGDGGDELLEVVVVNASVPPEAHRAARHLPPHPRLTILERHGSHPALVDAVDTDDGRYRQWMIKQSLDHALVMEACIDRGDLYLHVEDDALAASQWLALLRAWLRRHEGLQWRVVCLYHQTHVADGTSIPLETFTGMVAVAFHNADLRAVVDFVRAHCTEAPIDWLVRAWLQSVDGHAVVCTPCLFQHGGVVSSLPGTVQLAAAPTFVEPRGRHRLRQLTGLAHAWVGHPIRTSRSLWRLLRHGRR